VSEQDEFEFEWVDKNGSTNFDPNFTYGSGIYAVSGFTNCSTSNSTISSYFSSWSDPLPAALDKITKHLEAINDRLALLEELDDKEQHNMLREVYRKYKMVERLIGKDKTDE